MKRNFGTFISRLCLGGSKLTDFEYAVVDRLISELPIELKAIVESQFNAYNLLQREVDGRTLNFYRRNFGKKPNRNGLPKLAMNVEESPLIRLSVSIQGEQTINAVLTAVSGYAFCVTFNRRVDKVKYSGILNVTNIKQAWRSSVQTKSLTHQLSGAPNGAPYVKR